MTKLINTKDYLLLIEKGVEINLNDIITDTYNVWQWKDNCSLLGKHLVIAYYPLTQEAKELDLPLLPKFENQINPEVLALKDLNSRNKSFESIGRPDLKSNLSYENGYLDGAKFGYNLSQAKQFSLEDMKRCYEGVLQNVGTCITQKDLPTFDQYIQSLSTQQLPKEFILGEGGTTEEQIKNGYYE